jgi:hypothetical protein
MKHLLQSAGSEGRADPIASANLVTLPQSRHGQEVQTCMPLLPSGKQFPRNGTSFVEN